MKCFFKTILLALLIVAMLPVGVFAAEIVADTEEIIYLDNGNYITVEISSMGARASGSLTSSKTYRYYDSKDTEQWRAVLSGTFTYTGTTSTCTASSCSVTITNDSWYVVSKTASKSGSSATAELTMGRKLLGITIDKKSVSMRLTCDANGNLS